MIKFYKNVDPRLIMKYQVFANREVDIINFNGHYKNFKQNIYPEYLLQRINEILLKYVQHVETIKLINAIDLYETYATESCLDLAAILTDVVKECPHGNQFIDGMTSVFITWLDLLIDLYKIPAVFLTYPGLHVSRQLIKDGHSIYWQIITDHLNLLPLSPDVCKFVAKYYDRLDWNNTYLYKCIDNNFIIDKQDEMMMIFNWRIIKYQSNIE